MNFFLDQGRCRVCGKIFCCLQHQKHHEKQEHDEYSNWLEILPIQCRTCQQRISTIFDLNSKCVFFTKHNFTERNLTGTPRPNCKRRIDGSRPTLQKVIPGEVPVNRKILVPSYKHKKKASFNSQNSFFVDLKGMEISNVAINSIFSPQLNVSYKISTSDAKSSTPLNDEKENIAALVTVSVNNNVDITTYCTPENNNEAASLLLVSALKKMKSVGNSNKKSSDGRRVTFETNSPCETEISVYSTPMVTMTTTDETIDSNTMEDAEREIHQSIMLTPTAVTPTENIELDFYPDADVSNEPCEHKFSKMAKHFRLKLNGIPRSLSTMWEWTQRRMRRKKKRDEFDSPISKRKRMNATLSRRPIASYWVSMSINSLVRDPLPNYKEK